MSRSLARDSLLATYGLAFQGAARFVYTIVIGRVFGAHTLGAVSALLAAGVLFSLLWPTGSGLAASTYLSRQRRGYVSSDAAPALNRQIMIAVGAISVLAAVVGWLLSRNPSLTVGCALFTLTYGGYVYARGAQLGLGRVPKVAVWDTICGVIALAGLAAVIMLDLRSLILIPLALGYGAFTVFCWPTASGAEPVPWNDRALTRFVGTNTIAQIAGGGILPLSMLAAEVSGTALQTGIFAAAYALATPASMLGQSLQQVLVPHFSHDGSDDDRARDMWKVTLFAGGALVVVFAIVVLIAPFLIRLFFGAQFASGAAQMQWMLVAVLIASLALIPAAALIASGRPREFMIATIIGFVVGALLMFGLGHWLGTWSAVVGYAAGASVTSVLTYVVFWMRTSRRVAA